MKQFTSSLIIEVNKIHNILSEQSIMLYYLLQSLLKYFIKSFHRIYGNLSKDITMIMKTMENYYNVMLLYKIDFYKSD